MKMIEVSLEEYITFKNWYFEYAKLTQNIRKLKIKDKVGTLFIIDKKSNEVVSSESHANGKSKYRIDSIWYEMFGECE